MSAERHQNTAGDLAGDYRPSLPAFKKGAFCLKSHLLEIHNLRGIENLLCWDQQVCMPRAGSMERALQLEWVTKEIHERLTNPSFVGAVDELFGRLSELAPDEQVNIRELKRLLDRERRIPAAHAAEKARVAAMSYSAWLEAREKNDFHSVAPILENLLELCRREAEYLGYASHPYDAMLRMHDVELSSEQLEGLFSSLASSLVPLVKNVAQSQRPLAAATRRFAKEDQERLIRKILSDVGFDFQAGRLDETVHPFQSTIGHRDVRISTNYCVFDYQKALFSALHEAGHALYEMGLPPQHRGTPLGSALSLAMHESQSRLWENMIGRSYSFCCYLFDRLAEYLPDEHRALTPELLWQQVNRVSPGLIRIDADEISYSLHIIIRTRLEKALLGGDLCVRDLPRAWSELYSEYLGVTPEDDCQGVLQDVHWFSGDVGYFPTYVLGNLYGASIFESAKMAIPDLHSRIARGDFSSLNRWLSRNVYEKGMRFTPLQLLESLHLPGFTEKPFIRYLEEKFTHSASEGVKAA